MKNQKIIKCGLAILMVTFVALVLMGAIAAGGNKDDNYINGRYSKNFTVYNECTGEWIDLTGEIHVQGQIIVDGAGITHATGHLNAQLKGEGETSGVQYIGNARTNYNTKVVGDIEFPIPLEVYANLISKDSTENAVLKIPILVYKNGIVPGVPEFVTCRG